MPQRKQWDDEEEESSSAPSSPALGPVRRGIKFDDEEDQGNEVLDSWDVDSDVEREKAKKEEEAKAKAAAAASAPKKKSKTERIAEHRADRARRAAEDGESSDESETEAQKRERLRLTEKEADLRHAEDLFGGVGGVPATRKGTTVGTAVVVDVGDPTKTVDLTKMPLFNPTTKAQFETLRTTLTPVIGELHRKPHYALFLQEFAKQLAKDLASDQIKKVASSLTTLSNEKLKEEKAADKGGKKSKAQKTKTSLVTNRSNAIEVNNYGEETFGE